MPFAFFRLHRWSPGLLTTAALLGLCVPQSGCVRRRMTIRTNPPGAMVYVDDYGIGTTPVSTSFTYYGHRKIRLVKDGYQTQTLIQPIPAPWYQYPPLDFVVENLLPGEIRDHRVFQYQLTPQVLVPTDRIVGRGEALRSQVQSAAAVAEPAGQAPAAPEQIPAPPPQSPPSFNGGPATPDYPAVPPPAGSVPMHALPPAAAGTVRSPAP